MQLAKRLWQVSLALARFLLSGKQEGQDLPLPPPLLCLFTCVGCLAIVQRVMSCLQKVKSHFRWRAVLHVVCLVDFQSCMWVEIYKDYSGAWENPESRVSWLPVLSESRAVIAHGMLLKKEEAFQMNRNASLPSQGHIFCSASQTWVSSLTYIKHGVLRSWPFIWVLLFSVVRLMWTYCQSVWCLSSRVFYTTMKISVFLEP